MALKQGTQVRLIQHVIEGEIKGGTFIEGVPNYLISYKGADGEQHEGYFPEGALEEAPQEQ